MKAGIREVKSRFSHYANLAHKGKTVTVLKNNVPWFDLVPHQKPRRDVSPLKEIKTINSQEAALCPVDEKDIKGWI